MIKGARTISDFKIMRDFIENNFETGSVEVVFDKVPNGTGTIYDKVGNSASFQIDENGEVMILRYDIK